MNMFVNNNNKDIYKKWIEKINKWEKIKIENSTYIINEFL
jgi:hypothetical protein